MGNDAEKPRQKRTPRIESVKASSVDGWIRPIGDELRMSCAGSPRCGDTQTGHSGLSVPDRRDSTFSDEDHPRHPVVLPVSNSANREYASSARGGGAAREDSESLTVPLGHSGLSVPVECPRLQSRRRAVTGSRRLARRAGIQAAMPAAVSSDETAPVIAQPSIAPTS